MEKSLKTHIQKGNERTVVVIEGDDVHSRDKLAYYIARAYLMPDDLAKQVKQRLCNAGPLLNNKAEMIEVEGLKPVPYHPPKISDDQLAQYERYDPNKVVLSEGEYAGKTPDAAVRRNGAKAVALLFVYLRN